MAQKVYGKITNYRTGPKSQASKVCLIEFEGFDSAGLAGKLIGKKVKWKNETTSFLGRITGLHGKNGMVKVRFKHGVPGQAIGTAVEIIS
ncbi:MAG: 50S ribosomal protein L35ae [Crenarchaeota archaeon]|nr:50S ribosomal protein L35ae [Thermoproteota archaeon]